MQRSFLSGLVLIVFLWPAMVLAIAVDKDRLEDPALEARAHAVSKDLRCLVCQNQSIEDSNAELARDLRRIVRERIAAGDTDEEVRTYVVDRYGDWVLLRPPVKEETLPLWAAPFLFLAIGLIAIFFYVRGKKNQTVIPNALSAEEEARLSRLLDEESGKN